tara:strand:+ start:2460 stop:3488 length:1029 start_codon:yes stop_codon:yes gene_type:complete
MNQISVVTALVAMTMLMLIVSYSAVAQDDILSELAGEDQPTQTQAESEAAAAQATKGTLENQEAAETGDNAVEQSADTEGGAIGEVESQQSEAQQEGADAEEAAATEETSGLEEFLNSGALGLLLNGGAFMWPILLMGILAVGVIIERYRSLKMLNADDQQVREQVQQLLFDDNIEEALELCDSQQGPVPAVLSAGLRKYYVLRKLDYDVARTEEQVVKAMDDYSVHIVAGLERHLPVLATVSSAAPMLGFLGTVQGMIVAFQQIVEQMGETNIVEAAASGIQVSLLTTCFGLIVGIPAFVAFNYFTSVINRFVLQVEQSATELIENVSIQLAAAGIDGRDE